jgi:uncharacterized protein (DUF2141 family)
MALGADEADHDRNWSMNVKAQILALPPSMKAFFFSYLLLPLFALFGPSNPFGNLLNLESHRVVLLLGAYFFLPWILCYFVLRRSPMILPALLLQLGCIGGDLFVYGRLLEPDAQIPRIFFFALLIAVGILFTSRDILFPFIAGSKRGFRRAPRIYTNKSVAIVGPTELIPVILENCSLTGLAVFGESQTLGNFLQKRRHGVPFSICLDRRTPTNTVMATLVAERSDGTHMRLGLSVKDTQKMSAFIRSLSTKERSLKWKLTVFWNSSYFQRIAILTWVVSLAASIMLPALQDGHAATELDARRTAMIVDGSENRGAGELAVEVEGFTSDRGRLRLVIDNSSETYLGTGFILVESPIIGGKSKYVFPNLPFGVYAIRLFHDENDNGRLDTNLLGVPVEAYGFSNDARAIFGAPDFQSAKFLFESQQRKMTIHVKPHLSK